MTDQAIAFSINQGLEPVTRFTSWSLLGRTTADLGPVVEALR